MSEVSLSNMQEPFEAEIHGAGEQVPSSKALGHLSLIENLEQSEQATSTPLVGVEVDVVDVKTSPPSKKARARRSTRVTKRRADDIVQTYLEDIGQYDLLTKEDEERLAITREAGIAAQKKLADSKYKYKTERQKDEATVAAGKAAEQELIVSNLRLVVKVAAKYQFSNEPLQDLIQYGNTGLIHAVEKFDHRKGFKFSTYATYWIKQAIRRGIDNHKRNVRVPVHIDGRFREYSLATDTLLALGIQNPTDEQIAEQLYMDSDSETFLRLKDDYHRFSKNTVSMDTSGLDEDDRDKYDVIPDSSIESRPEEEATKIVEFEELYKLLEEAADLDERDREVIKLFFGLDRGYPRTLREVGEHFGISKERVRQIYDRAMARLRVEANKKGLRA